MEEYKRRERENGIYGKDDNLDEEGEKVSTKHM